MNIAKRMLRTGSPLYRRAFVKVLMGEELDIAEQSALGRGRGYAVPFPLDPSYWTKAQREAYLRARETRR
jgi:hypothetical protein